MLEFIRSRQIELLDRVTECAHHNCKYDQCHSPKLVIVPIYNGCSPKELVHTGQLLALCPPAFPATHNPVQTKGDEQRGFLTDLGEPWGSALSFCLKAAGSPFHLLPHQFSLGHPACSACSPLAEIPITDLRREPNSGSRTY